MSDSHLSIRRRTTSEVEASLPSIPEAGGRGRRSSRQGARTLEMGLEERRRKNMAWREARGGQGDQQGLAVWRTLQAELVCVSCQVRAAHGSLGFAYDWSFRNICM